MDVLLRESFFGRILNYALNDRFFPPPILKVLKNEETEDQLSSTASPNGIVVDFTGPDDPDIPRNWPALTKFVAMIDIMLLNFSFYAASALFTPSIPKLKEEFDATATEGTLGLSLFVIAYGIGPLIVRIRHHPMAINSHHHPADHEYYLAFPVVEPAVNRALAGVFFRHSCFLPV